MRIRPSLRSSSWEIARACRDTSGWLSIAVLIVICLEASIPLGFAGLTARLVSQFSGTDPGTSSVVLLCAGLAVLFFLLQILDPIREVFGRALGLRVRARLGASVLTSVAAPPGILHIEDPAVLDAVRNATAIGTSEIGPEAAVLGATRRAGPRLGAYLLAIALAGWSPALAAVVVVTRVWARGEQWKVMSAAADRASGEAEASRRAAYLRELGLGLPTAKELRLFGFGPWLAGRFREVGLLSMSSTWTTRRSGDRKLAYAAALLFVVDASVLLLVAQDAAQGTITPGRAALIIQALLGTVAISALTQADYFVNVGGRTLEYAEKLARILPATALTLPAGVAAVRSRSAGLSLSDVAFQYPSAPSPSLNGVSIEIREGDTVAIVGRNGAGKTTLAKVIAGLILPDSGQVQMGLVGLTDATQRDWQRRVAPVFQDFVRWPLTVAENVCPDPSRRDNGLIEHVSTIAGLDFVESLPGGWDTPLSLELSEGTELSGGQWQKLAIARALYALATGASVLLLDEPTAHLDVESELAFFDRVVRQSYGTTILISHRFSTVRSADQIVVLDEGVIVESGGHDELMAQSGLYRRMFLLQAGAFLGDVNR